MHGKVARNATESGEAGKSGSPAEASALARAEVARAEITGLKAELAAARELLEAAAQRAQDAEDRAVQAAQQADLHKAAQAQADLQALARKKRDTGDDTRARAEKAAAAKLARLHEDAQVECEDDVCEVEQETAAEAAMRALEEQLQAAAEERQRAEEAEKAKFEEDLLMLKKRQKVVISGATGFDGGSINGEYVPNGEMYNGHPLYYKNGDASKWLRFVGGATKRWMVSTIADTKLFNTKGLAESVEMNNEFPYQVKMWRLNQGLNSVTAAGVKCLAIVGTQQPLKPAAAPKTLKGLKDIKKASKFVSNAAKVTLYVYACCCFTCY